MLESILSVYIDLNPGQSNMFAESNEIFWGEMYLLSIDMSGEEYITVKYIQKSETNGHVRLVSQNKHHQDKDVELSKIKALALVKASIRINSMN